MRILSTTAFVAFLLTSACSVYKNSGRKQFEDEAGQVLMVTQCWLPLTLEMKRGNFSLCLTGVTTPTTEKP